MESRWLQEEDIAMSIDCGEEDWRRLHDIRLNGQVGTTGRSSWAAGWATPSGRAATRGT